MLMRAASAPANMQRGPKLKRSTLKRLTSIPAHKQRQNNRHFPQLPTGGATPDLSALRSSLMMSRPTSAKSEADEPAPENQSRLAAQESANERRKKFLTMSNLKRVFRALDLTDDGYIDVDELYEAQKKIGGKLSMQEVRDVIWEVDDDMDGRLSMQDYLTSYRRTQVCVCVCLMPSSSSSTPPPCIRTRSLFARPSVSLACHACCDSLLSSHCATCRLDLSYPSPALPPPPIAAPHITPPHPTPFPPP